LDTLSDAEQKSQAFNLGIAALLGEGIYNLGELVLLTSQLFNQYTINVYSFFLFLKLAHPVLESLKNHENNWLVDLLFIMNAGDLVAFHKLKPKWSTQADLANNERIILQKITLLALMEV